MTPSKTSSAQSKQTPFKPYYRQLSRCFGPDRAALHRRLRQLEQAHAKGKPTTAGIAALKADINGSRERVAAREAALPAPTFDGDLPVVMRREAIAEAIANNQVIVVCGDTGSGKTTQLPKICLAAGRGARGLIGHTQPRRLAARSVAGRIASELNTEVGQAVGYKMRFADRTNPDGHIKLMTDGILLQELQQDRFLNDYDTLIIDEAHERSLNIDFILGYIKRLLPKRPDLKVIVTSATIDPQRFSQHFHNAPVLQVEGRMYPVEVRYRPPTTAEDDEDARDRDLQQTLLDSVDELAREGPGDMLIFLAGEREIRETAEALRKHHPQGAEILPLYARLSAEEQNRVFKPHGKRRLVLATNVAETSITVPGIRYVIDTGTARISRYSWRAKLQRLPIERISQASAEQRKGRCGRVAAGICVRLYSEEDFNKRPRFTDPEILRTNLAAVILQMAYLRLGDVAKFPFVQPPDQRLIRDGYKLLFELGAVDAGQQLTALGKRLARLPIDPRLGRMLLAAEREGSLREVLIITSALELRDPRERPHEQRQAADDRHKQWQDERSDFLSLLNLWEWFHGEARRLSKTKLREACREQFVSYVRLREWQDLHRQLRQTLLEAGYKENTTPAEYAPIHRALLAGLLGNLGYKGEDSEYLGARNRKFRIFPGSALFKKTPKWVMAAEIAETTQVWARTVAKLDPAWIEAYAGHLLHYHYYEPHWEKRAGQVTAYAKVTLYGLVVDPRRRVNYGPLAPAEAREIFIRQALVEGDFQTRGRFLQYNRDLMAEVEQLEAKSRRRDILVDEQTLFEFYAERLPAEIYNGPDFEQWRQQVEQREPDYLLLTRAALMRHEASAVTAERFPDQLRLGDARFPLRYRFEPNAPDDGVTLRVPVAAIDRLDPGRLEWLVPGLLEEKIAALLKSLPKSLRRHFVPVPDFARACLEALGAAAAEQSLTDALAQELLRMTGETVPADAWRQAQLPDHLRMRIEVVDPQGQVMAAGRDLAQVRAALADEIQAGLAQREPDEFERAGLTDWDFGELPETVEIDAEGIILTGYPALVAENGRVALRLLDTPAKAERAMPLGLRRLYQQRLKEEIQYLYKKLPGMQQQCLQFSPLGSCNRLKDDIIEAAIDRVLVAAGRPRDKLAFENILAAGRRQVVAEATEIAAFTGQILARYNAIRQRLKGDLPLSWIEAVKDINDQLAHLIYPGFVTATPAAWLAEIPRYLDAIERRLARLDQHPDKDRRQRVEIEPFWQRYKEQRPRNGAAESTELIRYRWLVEELRVSLFAQELGTSLPVSAKRLEKQWHVALNGAQ